MRKLPPDKCVGADDCADYLIAKRSMLRYDRYLGQGLPIATGVIEGACRNLIVDRMDITGARWSVSGAEAILPALSPIQRGLRRLLALTPRGRTREKPRLRYAGKRSASSLAERRHERATPLHFTTRQAGRTLPETVLSDRVVGEVARALLAKLRAGSRRASWACHSRGSCVKTPSASCRCCRGVGRASRPSATGRSPACWTTCGALRAGRAAAGGGGDWLISSY